MSPQISAEGDGKNEPHESEKSTWEKIQIPYNPDCVSCKIIGMLTLYGAGVLVLTNIKRVPETNKVGRVVMGLFGLGLLGSGTMRIFVK